MNDKNKYEVTAPDSLSGIAPEKALGEIAALYQAAGDLQLAQQRVSRLRDLTVVDLMGDLAVVIACDSNAGIGLKPMDSIQKPYTEQGVSILKVPMIEVLASGATPMLVVNNLCFEMEPYGKEVIENIRKEMTKNGFDPDVQLTGSTEDNAVTFQTGSGLTVIGMAKKSEMRLGKSLVGDVICCVGDPRDGGVLQYSEFDRNTLSIADTVALTKLPYVHEILPCGSHGALYEAAAMAAGVGGSFRLYETKFTISLNTSAGSCTCCLVTLAKKDLDALRRDMDILITPIGTIGEAIV